MPIVKPIKGITYISRLDDIRRECDQLAIPSQKKCEGIKLVGFDGVLWAYLIESKLGLYKMF